MSDSEAAAFFDRGDYTKCYQKATAAALRGAALVMMGDFERGLEFIGEDAAPRSRFCRALAAWGLGGDASTAIATLGQIVDPAWRRRAERLATYLSKPKIRLLLQAREFGPMPNWDVVGQLKKVPFLDIRTVGYASCCDIVIHPGSTLEEVLSALGDWRPDFYLNNMVEDHPPPVGLERAPFPLICSTQDFDRHLHHTVHQIGLFDAAVAYSTVDHPVLEAYSGGKRAFVYPFLLGFDVPESAEQDAGSAPKELDVYVSGSLFNYSEGKSRLLFEIGSSFPEYRIGLQQGLVPEKLYFARLAGAKATVAYIHRWGIINSRAFEAIANGCCALVQDGGEMSIFLGEEDGIVPYSLDNYRQKISDVVENWDRRYADVVRRGAEKVRTLFDFERCMRRFAVVLAGYASFCDERRRPPASEAGQIMFANRSARRIAYYYDGSFETIFHRQRQFRETLRVESSYMHADLWAESILYDFLLAEDIAKSETRIWSAYANFVGSEALERLVANKFKRGEGSLASLREATEAYRRLSERFPDRLAAVFNLGRLNFELGKYEESLAAMMKVVEDTSLSYVATDTLFWREFQDKFFEYHRMMEEMTTFFRDSDAAHLASVERMIRDSGLLYAAKSLGHLGRGAEALELLNAKMREKTELAGLWIERFRLRAAAGEQAGALADIRAIFADQPHVVAVFGDEIVETLAASGLDFPALQQRWQLLKSRYV